MDLHPIGVVHSPIRERKQMPPFGVPAEVEVYAQFAPALLNIEKHSHLAVLQVTPRGVTDRGPDGLHGVFAVRSPARPNPIGLTAVRVTARDGLRIGCDRLDFLDGTPVVDLKPYFVSRDMIFSANGRQVGRPRSREALRESLAFQARLFCDGFGADAALAVRVIEHYRTCFHDLNDVPAWRLAAPLGRPELADALQGMTRVSAGRGSLLFHSADEVVCNQEACYRFLPGLPSSTEAVMASPDEALFTFSAAAPVAPQTPPGPRS
jgi:tRNA-Thr(GGU) m(6)t(6)A37 methyltransferase TsaA